MPRELTVNMAKSKWPEIGSKLTIHTTATKSGEENFLGRSRPDVRPRTEGSVRNQHQHSHSSFTFESGPAQRIDPKFEHPYRRYPARDRPKPRVHHLIECSLFQPSSAEAPSQVKKKRRSCNDRSNYRPTTVRLSPYWFRIRPPTPSTTDSHFKAFINVKSAPSDRHMGQF